MSVVIDEDSGGRDALVVRACADGFEGWGKCEASTFESIAARAAPMLHARRSCIHSFGKRDLSDLTRIAADGCT